MGELNANALLATTTLQGRALGDVAAVTADALKEGRRSYYRDNRPSERDVFALDEARRQAAEAQAVDKAYRDVAAARTSPVGPAPSSAPGPVEPLAVGQGQAAPIAPAPGPTTIRNSDHPLARLSKPGDVIRLSPEEAAAYKAVRTAMDAALDLFKQQQTIREWGLDPDAVTSAKEIEDLAGKAANATEEARLKKLASIVREIEQAKRQGYVPFQRWGQVGIVVKRDGEVDPKTGLVERETVYFEMIEVDGLAQRAKRALRLSPAEFGRMPEVKAALDRVKAEFGDKPGHKIDIFQVPPNTPMAGRVQIADLDMLAQVAQIDEATWDSVKAGLETAIQARGFKSHFFGARNTPGYSADFERAIADYVVGISGYLARRRFAGVWQHAIEAIPRTMPRLPSPSR